MPFLLDNIGYTPALNFTAVIFVQIGSQVTPSTALYKLVKSITRSQYIDKVNVYVLNLFFVLMNYFILFLQILILWTCDRPIPSKKRWPNTGR